MLAGLCLAGGCGTDRHTVVLDGFPTLQQSTDYTCGPASSWPTPTTAPTVLPTAAPK